MKSSLTLLAVMLSATLAAGASFPAGTGSEIRRYFPSTPQEINEPVRIFAHFQVGETAEISGFYYSELLPNWIHVRPDIVTANGLFVNCAYEIGLPGALLADHVAHRWVIDDPKSDGGYTLRPGDQVLISYILYAARSGTLQAAYDGWSGELAIDEGVGVFGYDDNTMEIQFGDQVSVPAAAPPALALAPAFPNPFNPSTRLSLSTNRPRVLRLDLFDAKGRRVRTLAADRFETGTHEVLWDGRSDAGAALPSGLYLARLSSPDGHAQSQKLLLLK